MGGVGGPGVPAGAEHLEGLGSVASTRVMCIWAHEHDGCLLLWLLDMW